MIKPNIWLVWFVYWFVALVLMFWLLPKIEQPSRLETINFPNVIVIQGNSLKASAPVTIPRAIVLASKYDTDPRVIEYILDKFGEHGEAAVRVVFGESGFNPAAVNYNDAKITGCPSKGLFQINSCENWNWKDYKENTDRAWKKFQDGGWIHWKNTARLLGLL